MFGPVSKVQLFGKVFLFIFLFFSHPRGNLLCLCETLKDCFIPFGYVHPLAAGLWCDASTPSGLTPSVVGRPPSQSTTVATMVPSEPLAEDLPLDPTGAAVSTLAVWRDF